MSTKSTPKRGATTRLMVLAAAMAVLAVPLLAFASGRPLAEPPTALPWFVLALGFLVTDLAVVELHIRRDAHRASLSEIPLLLGLATASPLALVGGRLAAALSAAAVKRRQPPSRLIFNLSLGLLEVAVGLAIYRGMINGASQVSAAGLGIAVAALVGVLVVSGLLVMAALVLTQPGRSIARILQSLLAAFIVSLVASATAILGLVLFWAEPASILAVGLSAVILYAGLRGYASLSRRYEDLAATHSFISAIDGASDMDELLEASLESVENLFGADFTEVVLSQGVSSVSVRRSDNGGLAKRPAPPDVIEALSGEMLSGPEVVLLDKAPEAVTSHYQDREVGRAMLATIRGEGGTAALIAVGDPRSGREYTSADLALLASMARQARVSFDRGRLVDRLRREVGQKEHQALHDALTGLPNRLHFTIVVEDALRRAREAGSRVAVLLIDIDRFKEINDTLGHQRGDMLIQEIALRLTEELGEDHVARLGGDEFGVVLREVEGVADAAEGARKIGEVLQRPFLNEGLTIQVSGSIGISLAPDHGAEGAALLRRADVAMYEAKAHGSTFEVYDPQRDGYSTRRLAMAAELREAVESGALAVHYQPKVSMRDGSVLGVEALVRWIHPRHGMIPPDEFIELAERTGLIGPLTEHVMRVAFRDRSRLAADGHRLTVAVNVAASSLVDAEFPDLVAQLIAEQDVDPLGVILEVTETTMMTDSARSRLVLSALDEIGVGLSIDDFGTGYSSLSYLSSLPVDEVKIDRSFVMDMAVDERLAKIVTSTSGLVHSLGLRVVAEGVENRGTWELLEAAKCDIAQGFYIAKPMGFTDLGAWLASGSEFEGDSGRSRLPGSVVERDPAR